MCGIHCCICFKEKKIVISENHKETLQRRGPDKYGNVEINLENWHLSLFAFVLHMQGGSLTAQPATSTNGNILLYTGEIFAGIKVDNDDSDTSVLLESLDRCSTSEDMKKVFTSIEGPWSLVYFHNSTQTLWFGRDYFGRRSLLISIESNSLTLSSVADRPKNSTNSWHEVPTGLHYINLTESEDIVFNVRTFPWMSLVSKHPKVDFSNFDLFKVISDGCLISPASKRCQISDRSNCDIDEVNQLTKLDATSQLVKACDVKNLWPVCEQFNKFLKKAVSRRTKALHSWKERSKIGVLFSGGVDCTMLAYLASEVVPLTEPIDLLNVAFEQTKSNLLGDEKSRYAVPDRITGLNSLHELKKLCPNRQWNFVEINVAFEELKKYRSEKISDLTYPKQTVLDDSIGCALWFASRGRGFVNENDVEMPYESDARILLCGMGADEQLGGYSRHRTVFQRTGENWKSVESEMNMEIDRISSRNLGRDDRIVSDHGKEARFPYLDEELVGFLSSLSVPDKTDFRFQRGVGEKILLRGAAHLVGLRDAAVLPKRAIQFGSRIAKIENAREKGSDVCSRLITS